MSEPKFDIELLGYFYPQQLALEKFTVAAKFYLDPDKFRADCLQETRRLEAFLKKEFHGVAYKVAMYVETRDVFYSGQKALRVYEYPAQVRLGGVVVRPGETLCINKDGRAGVANGKKVMWASHNFEVHFNREYGTI